MGSPCASWWDATMPVSSGVGISPDGTKRHSTSKGSPAAIGEAAKGKAACGEGQNSTTAAPTRRTPAPTHRRMAGRPNQNMAGR